MLSQATLTAFVPTSDVARAQEFFVGVLGLELVYSDNFACVVRSDGVTVRVTQVRDHQSQAFTVLGWEVDDIRTEIADLSDRGVVFARFAGLSQDDLGVWTEPGGAQVAWFHDPDGNVLSLTQHPA